MEENNLWEQSSWNEKKVGLIKKEVHWLVRMDLAQELRADEGEVVKVYDQQRHF